MLEFYRRYSGMQNGRLEDASLSDELSEEVYAYFHRLYSVCHISLSLDSINDANRPVISGPGIYTNSSSK